MFKLASRSYFEAATISELLQFQPKHMGAMVRDVHSPLDGYMFELGLTPPSQTFNMPYFSIIASNGESVFSGTISSSSKKLETPVGTLYFGAYSNGGGKPEPCSLDDIVFTDGLGAVLGIGDLVVFSYVNGRGRCMPATIESIGYFGIDIQSKTLGGVKKRFELPDHGKLIKVDGLADRYTHRVLGLS